jgi:hypothetical protein
MSAPEKIKYIVVYANGNSTIVSDTLLLSAQKRAHKEAKERKTIVLSIDPIIN